MSVWKSAVADGRWEQDMEEFIRTLTEQIRCIKARDAVAREIENHIMDQAEHFEAEGMDPERAQREAVAQMGDPVSIGVQLDHIHRPRTDWDMVCMVIGFSIGGVIIQYLMGALSEPWMLWRQCVFTGIGLILMAGIYYLDYSFIGNHAKELYTSAVLLCILSILMMPEVNGMHRGMIMPMYLFVPLYGGILYQYRGQGYGGVVKSIAFLLIPVYIGWRGIPSVVTAFHLCVICGCMLLIAIGGGWFLVNKVKMVVTMMITGMILPAIFGAFAWFFLMADYQKIRLQAFLNPSFFASDAGYIYGWARRMLAGSRFIGRTAEEVDHLAGSDFLLMELVVTYGSFFGILVVVALIALILRAFHISAMQKNRLGFMIGTGIGLVFLLLVVEGIGVNFTILPATTVTLPFLTVGGTATFVYDILIGLLLAIYRYKNILGERTYKARWKIGVRMEKL